MQGASRFRRAGRRFDERPVTLTVGTRSFLRLRRCEPVAMEHVFPVKSLCIARECSTTCRSTRKRAWQRMPILRLPWAKSLSLVAIPAAGWQKAMVAALAR